MDERELVIKLKTGDLNSFEELLSKYERQIFNYSYRLTLKKADAEDLVQETFLRLYDKRKTLDPEQGVKNWLYTVATNAAYDIFRKRKRSNELPIGDDGEIETIEPSSPYHNIERAKDVESALERLKPQYRSALVLFYKEGFTYEEISVFLKVPLNTVKTYIRRGKEALKELLPDYAPAKSNSDNIEEKQDGSR